MAELATLARPYAEAMFEVAEKGDLKQAGAELDALAAVSANPQLREFADAPNTLPQQVFDVLTSVANVPLSEASKNLLRAVIDNGRLSVMDEIAAQFHALVSARSGVSDAIIYSAFPIEDAQLGDVVSALEKRFKRKLNASVEVQPELIGGIRVVVGDEVFDTSVKARLEQMKAALTA
jgi:F-type H+-transporting ATPase subunit delta